MPEKSAHSSKQHIQWRILRSIFNILILWSAIRSIVVSIRCCFQYFRVPLLQGQDSLPKSQELTQTTHTSDTAIFFNVFLPGGDQRARAMSITKSQMQQIQSSDFASTTIYCNVFGDINSTKAVCQNNPNCKIMSSKETGDERDTLTALYRFCVGRPDATVVYLHNKGSFHDTEENSALRTMHMRAQVETRSCIDSVRSGTCNVCSARFSPLPHFHTSGNMWTAHCSYVKILVAPEPFEQKMDDVINALKEQKDVMAEMFPCVGPGLDCLEPSHFGMGRYSYEHWIHSHPTVIPCDVLPTNYSFVWKYNNIPKIDDEWQPEIHVGARFPLSNFLNDGYLPMNAKWFTLKGRLFEWTHLFGHLAPKDSWVWHYYGTTCYW